MFALCANKVILKKLEGELLAAGAANVYACRFDLSDDWDGLTVKAVFRTGGTEKQVDVIDGECTIPWEVLREEGEALSVGLYGENADQGIVLPTLWAELGKIRDAAGAHGSVLPPVPGVYEQLLEKIDSKITNPATGMVGQALVVAEVDKTGKPTKWVAADVATGGGSLSITDDGNGNVFIGSTGSISITDDGAGNVTIQ